MALWRIRAVRTDAGAGGRVFTGYVADHWCKKGHVLLVLEVNWNEARRWPHVHALP